MRINHWALCALLVCLVSCGADEVDPIACAPPVDGECGIGCARVETNREFLTTDHCTEADFTIGCIDERLRGRFREERVYYMVPGRPDERFHHPGVSFKWYELQGRELGYCVGDDIFGLLDVRPEDFCRELNDDFERRCEALGRI
jgi:hypothetical protein